MIRPKVFSSLLAAFAALLMACGAFAAEPTLTTKDAEPLPATLKQNEAGHFVLVFKDADNDRIKSAVLRLTTPGGESTINGKWTSNDTASGVDVSFDAKMSEPGQYKARFVVSSADGDVSFPAQDAPPYGFAVENLPIKIGIFVAGLLVALAGLPFMVYQISRSANKNGDPSGAARGALLLGILASAALFIYLFAASLGPLAIAIGVVAGLAGIVTVLTQKRR